MNEWMLAAIVLLAIGLMPLAAVAVLSDTMSAAVALNLGGPVTALVLVLLAEATHRQSFVDLGVVAAAVSSAGSLVLARFLEPQA